MLQALLVQALPEPQALQALPEPLQCQAPEPVLPVQVPGSLRLPPVSLLLPFCSQPLQKIMLRRKAGKE
ncbi:MAG: hypothetical protein HY742_01115 [Deltaproteobacteria bacterium]|nr:hypothetical protein [Deltaproteobacteria bacterium]